MWLVAVVGRCVVGCEHCLKHVETEVDNKHLIVVSFWFSLFSHFAHDARSQEPKAYMNKLRPLFKDNIIGKKAVTLISLILETCFVTELQYLVTYRSV